jgi:hypothetical protein
LIFEDVVTEIEQAWRGLDETALSTTIAIVMITMTAPIGIAEINVIIRIRFNSGIPVRTAGGLLSFELPVLKNLFRVLQEWSRGYHSHGKTTS